MLDAEEDPEKAAQAVQLGDAMDVPATTVHNDFDNYNTEYRAALTNHLVSSSPALAQYISSHPLAAQISNDDWGNLSTLATSSQATQEIQNDLLHRPWTALQRYLGEVTGAAAAGAVEGFGPQSLAEDLPSFADARKNVYGVAGADAATLVFGAGDLLQRSLGAAVGAIRGAATQVGGEQFGRDIGAMTEYEMMKGETGGHPEAGVDAHLAQQAQANAQAFHDAAMAHARALDAVRPWVEAGKEPPIGLNPHIDMAKAAANQTALDGLDRDLANAQASLTKERSPELFNQFLEQRYGNSTISIGGDAAASLYGDKPPALGDNLLGFVPGIESKLDLARATGEDISVPIKDWIGKVDPAVARQLNDDIRMWPGGVTAAEAKAPAATPELVDAPLPQVRGTSGLEPMFSMGDRKLSLANMKPEEFGADVDGVAMTSHSYDMLDENGQKVGDLEVIPGRNKELYVNMINGSAGMWANSFGPSLIRDIKGQLKALYPDYDTLTGHRVTGARETAGRGGDLARVRLDTPSGWGKVEAGTDFADTRDILSGAWKEFHPDVQGYTVPFEAFSPEQQAMAKAGMDELRTMVGDKPEVLPVGGVQFGNHVARGVYIPSATAVPKILVDLNGLDPRGTFRHEGMHYLRQYGFITPEEWTTLANRSIAENWHGKFNIEERYHGSTDEQKLEESIADGYREWAGQNPRPHDTVFQKIKDLLDRIVQRVSTALGRPVTADDILHSIQRGDVAKRGPGEPTVEGALDLRPSASIDDLDNLRANAVGLDLQTFRKMQAAIQEKYASDVEASVDRAAKEQARRQTTEWKANRKEMLGESQESLRQRPDVAADLFLGNGELHGEKLRQRYTLASDDLTPEQRALLPTHYVSKNGLPVDGVAKMFGFPSGDSLVERLGVYQATKEGRSPTEQVSHLAGLDADRQMEAKYGSLGDNIFDAAKDQALSENNLNLLAEEYVAVGMRTGQPVMDIAAARSAVRDEFGKMPVGAVNSDRYMATMARHYQNATKALVAGDHAGALRSLQQRLLSGLLAGEARKLEKDLARFDKTAKPFGKRFDPTKSQNIAADFSVAIRDILSKTDRRFGMTPQGLAKAWTDGRFGDLGEFVRKTEDENKLSGMELNVPQFLMDPKYRKPVADMTTDEFRQMKQGVDTLNVVGKAEQKVLRQGQKVQLAEWRAEALDQLAEKFDPIVTPATPKRGALATGRQAYQKMLAASTNNETLMSRFDGRDPHGIFTETISYPAAEASNNEAVMQRETARKYGELGEIPDRTKALASPVKDPRNGLPREGFTRENLAVIISNMGNDYNWNVLAKGYGVDPQALWRWVEKNSTAEDLLRAQKLSGVFSSLKRQSDMVYQHLYGIAPEDVVPRPFVMHGKRWPGWYHPIIGDPELSRKVNGLPDPAGPEVNFWPSTSNSYTMRRTGAIQVIDLTYDSVPSRIQQMIHDIAYREFVANTARIFKNGEFRQGITKFYGRDYMEEMDAWLNRIAGNASYNSSAMRLANRVSGYFRQNVITTQIAFNLGTVEKHGLTAFAMSARELGDNLAKSLPSFARITAEVVPAQMVRSVRDMFGKSPDLGETLWQFVKRNSEEIQRRERNFLDTMVGQHQLYSQDSKLDKIRNLTSQYGAKLVALSDMVSAVPLWLAKYRQEFEGNGGVHGDAVRVADAAVRRAHGSTAITNLPRIATGDNPVTPWLTSLYGFMGTSMQRRIEIFHDLNDAYKLGMGGDIRAAGGKLPGILSSLGVYVLWTGIVEEGVAGQFTDDRRGLGTKALTFLFGTVAQSVIGLRDLVHDVATGEESVGLGSTPLHHVNNLIRDATKHRPFDRDHAGKLIQDGLTEIGDLFGVAPQHVGTIARYAHDAFTGFQTPRTPGDVYRGLVSGSQKQRIEK